jgi:hypothetical protein
MTRKHESRLVGRDSVRPSSSERLTGSVPRAAATLDAEQSPAIIGGLGVPLG